MVLADYIHLFLYSIPNIPKARKFAEKLSYTLQLMSNLEMSIKLYVCVIYRQNYYISIPKNDTS